MTRAWAVLGATMLGGATGCISLSTYEHDLALARAETKSAQAAQAMQAEALVAALQAMHKALEAESELRAVTVRTLEAQLRRLGEERPRGPRASEDAASAREELARLREQERVNAERLRRLEESMLQLVSRTRPSAAAPSAKLHEYPY